MIDALKYELKAIIECFKAVYEAITVIQFLCCYYMDIINSVGDLMTSENNERHLTLRIRFLPHIIIIAGFKYLVLLMIGVKL